MLIAELASLVLNTVCLTWGLTHPEQSLPLLHERQTKRRNCLFPSTYVRKYGGQFWSVDINKNLIDENIGKMCSKTHLVCDESVYFFTNCVITNNKQADVIYLDN